MKISRLIAILFAVLVSVSAMAQERGKDKDKKEQGNKSNSKKRKKQVKGYKKTGTGLYYKFHNQNQSGVKAKVDEFVTVNMTYRNENDSVIFDSKTIGQKMEFPLQTPTFKGSLEEGLAMMSEGDSASFLVHADSLYIKTFGLERLPAEIPSGSLLRFEVKLVDIRTKEDLEKEQMEAFLQEMAKLEQRKFEEPGEIAKYIADHDIKVAPTQSGLYYIEKAKGRGPKIQEGDTVLVHYTCMFLDGKVIDTSVGGEPLEMVAGIGMVIQGWDEAIQMMSVGTKATLVVPSSIAYGESGIGEGMIPPYTPLLFDVEVVKKR